MGFNQIVIAPHLIFTIPSKKENDLVEEKENKIFIKKDA